MRKIQYIPETQEGGGDDQRWDSQVPDQGADSLSDGFPQIADAGR
jgi:hypothetical protein